MYEVCLRNCKNFDEASFCIEPKKLNIKYAPNGTGKSSIADGIRCAITSDQRLLETIKPFKFRDAPDSPSFDFDGLDSYKSVEVFNESYVNNVVFVSDGLFAPSFDVFVKNQEYEDTLIRIDQLFGDVQKCLGSSAFRDLGAALEVLSTSICGNSGLTGRNSLRATAPAKKGLSKGNPRTSIPDQFSSFRRYIDSKRLSKWAKWHANGFEMLDENDDCCPFCGQEIVKLRPVIEGVHENYASATADNLDKVLAGIVSAKSYLCSETANILEDMIQESEPLSETQENYLVEVVCQANVIVERFRHAGELTSYFGLAKAGKSISDEIADCIIDLNLLTHFNSVETKSAISEFNEALAKAQEEAQVLFGVINKQKSKLAKSLAAYEAEINSFLSGAGYPYFVKIDATDDDQCSVRLIHASSYSITNASDVLSFGEKNALALVFFMYSTLSSNPDLIILDDPITSFDGHKRFAILHMLFLKDEKSPNTLKNRTVILLTHEYGVVFDVEHTLKREFQPLAKTTLLYSAAGTVCETVIEKEDMMPVRVLYQDLARNSECLFVRLVYARKLLELDNRKDLTWSLLSSLFHHRDVPIDTNERTLSKKQIQEASCQIELMTNEEFVYETLLQEINNLENMKSIFDGCSCKYEKLQIARIALDGENIDRVSKKLLDETLHVDNGYIFQLDPRVFEMVPDSVIEQCEAAFSANSSIRQDNKSYG